MSEIPVKRRIKEITVVNERQKLFKNSVQTHELFLTRAVIFKFEEDIELSFEKNVWFSEDITVQQGRNLLSELSPTEEFSDDWKEPYCGICKREIIILNDENVLEKKRRSG